MFKLYKQEHNESEPKFYITLESERDAIRVIREWLDGNSNYQQSLWNNAKGLSYPYVLVIFANWVHVKFFLEEL